MSMPGEGRDSPTAHPTATANNWPFRLVIRSPAVHSPGILGHGHRSKEWKMSWIECPHAETSASASQADPIELAAGAMLPVEATHQERAIYIATGEIEVRGRRRVHPAALRPSGPGARLRGRPASGHEGSFTWCRITV
jgi:hypothetical protein